MLNSLARHLREHLFWYSLVSIGLGWIGGLLFPDLPRTHADVFKTMANILVFLMIYPMMINLRVEKLLDVAKDPKPVLLSLFYNFLLTPGLSYLLARLFFQGSPDVALGFWLVMLIPGSSMSLGYTGLTGGNLEVGAIALGLNFVIVPVILPFLMHLLGKTYEVHVPLGTLIWTVVLVLLLPMILGDLTRRLIIRKGGQKGYESLKPLFSSVTMLGMFLIVALIFFTKAELLTEKWTILIPLLVVTFLYLLVMFPLITWINRYVGLSYEEHMGIVFLSTGKNNGTAIAIALMGFSPLTAIPAATLPLFQIVFSIAYVLLAPKIRSFFERR
ncbi:Bile acid:sodium symporter [Spirochaeta thermophila DSM 6578]|uniref:Bile acid:sodium symporter n=1 Tax=Winmispira thermophila (strain ATCC 700085 / DSM 6578 / Z-1203) TaxID=869211 RepID=G0GE95_WINT7|nr:bile acid:sodium symporter [Spirochaeta thermophila]AEJ61448.1 Bile acid:sodium symporter [Spirochaeta thermophila DSM 6578]